ncbi:MAG: hypothetical protein AAB380_05185 [Verrucomicrobiota bacterium]
MSAAEITKELAVLPRPERLSVARRALETLCTDTKAVERIMRRIENSDVPEDVWRGIEEAEDGKLIDMDEALTELDRP